MIENTEFPSKLSPNLFNMALDGGTFPVPQCSRYNSLCLLLALSSADGPLILLYCHTKTYCPKTYHAFSPPFSIPQLLGLPQLESFFFFSWQSPTYSSNWCHLPLMLSLVHQPSLSTLPLGSKSIRIMPLLWQQSHFLGLIFCGCFSPLCQILKSLRAERLAHRDVPKDK